MWDPEFKSQEPKWAPVIPAHPWRDGKQTGEVLEAHGPVGLIKQKNKRPPSQRRWKLKTSNLSLWDDCHKVHTRTHHKCTPKPIISLFNTYTLYKYSLEMVWHGHDGVLSLLSPGPVKIISCVYLSPALCLFPLPSLIFFCEKEKHLSSVFLSDTRPWGIV